MMVTSLSLSADAFPLDAEDGDHVRTVRDCVFSRCLPTPLGTPITLAAVSKVSIYDQIQTQHRGIRIE